MVDQFIISFYQCALSHLFDWLIYFKWERGTDETPINLPFCTPRMIVNVACGLLVEGLKATFISFK